MNRLLEILGSVSLTVIVLSGILVACSIGTLMRFEAGLERIYHTPWFFTLLGILAVNTLACVLKEMRRRRVPWSFLFLHFGTVVILAGGAWGHLKGVKGYVSIPEGMAATQFYPNWIVRDLLVRRDGKALDGEFRGIERNQVFFTPRFQDSAGFPLTEISRISVDPDRPGRVYEKDLLHLTGGKRILGLMKAVEEGEVRFETEGEEKSFPLGDVIFLRMGGSAVEPLGFTLRLKDFRIEYYPETAENRVLIMTPAGKSIELPSEPGREADLGDGYRVKILRYLPDAVVSANNELITRSDQPNNPAVEVEINWEGGVEKLVSFAKFPSFHGSRKESGVDLKLLSSAGMPKSFISEIEVIDPDVPVNDEIIRVNKPFTYKGYIFYQSSYSLDSNPVRSVLQVVRDPGLKVTYAGFILLMLGCTGLMYVRPLRRKQRRATQPSTPSGEKG